MATSTLEVVIRGRDMLSGTLSKVSSELGGLQSKSDGLKGSILAGVGLGAGVAGFGLLSTAIQKGVDVLGDAVNAAMEDERSVSRLSVSLRDNVPAWNGSTAAIEKSIAARTRLGFEDDVLRQGLGTLVARTHDVSKAMGLLDSAMNLARFRGTDLGTAVDLLGKAYDGNVGALRRAGIAVDEHATAQQALATVLRSTGGQAEAYADTSMGKLEAAQVKAKEATERLGKSLTPGVAGAAGLAADAVDLLSLSLDGYAKMLAFLGGPGREFFNQTEENRKALQEQQDALHSQTSALDTSALHTTFAKDATASYRDVLHEAADAARDEAAATLTAAQAYQLYLYTMHNTVNAQTGFTVDTYQQVDAGKAAISNQLDWIIAQQHLTTTTYGGAAAVRDYTAATEESTAAVKEWVSAVTAADKAAAQQGHALGPRRSGDKGAHSTFPGSNEPELAFIDGKPVYKMPKAAGSGQTVHTWNPNGATGGGAGMGGGTAASYDSGAGVPIVITLDGRVIAEVVDTYLARIA